LILFLPNLVHHTPGDLFCLSSFVFKSRCT